MISTSYLDTVMISTSFSFLQYFHQNAPTTRTWKTPSEEWDFIMATTVITSVIIYFHLVGIGFAGQLGLRCPHHVWAKTDAVRMRRAGWMARIPL